MGKGTTTTLRAAHSWPSGYHISRAFWSTDGQRILLDLACGQPQPACQDQASSSRSKSDHSQTLQLWQLLDAKVGTPLGSMPREVWDGMVPVQQPETNHILVQAGPGQLAQLNLVSLDMAPPPPSVSKMLSVLSEPVEAQSREWMVRQARYTSDGAWVAVLVTGKSTSMTEPITAVLIAGCHGQAGRGADLQFLKSGRTFSSMSWSPNISGPELAVVSIDSLLSQDTNGLERVTYSQCTYSLQVISPEVTALLLSFYTDRTHTWSSGQQMDDT